MESGRVACKVGVLRRNVAPIGRLVCRLISLYLVYSTPALAHDPGRDSRPAEDNRMLSESLDPKHDKDHDRDPVGGGSCPREPSAAPIWNPAEYNTAIGRHTEDAGWRAARRLVDTVRDARS
jgi:hypothetical protein